MPLDVIGSTESVEQGIQKRLAPGGGEAQVRTWRGLNTAVEQLYETVKLLALTDPTYQDVQYNAGRGNATLTVTQATQQSITATDVENGVETVYEMFPNEFTKRVEQAPYFDTLTAAQIAQVYQSYNAGILSTDTGFTSKQLDLMKLLERGTTEYFATGYVLRVTKTVSGRANVQASFTDVNRVVTPNVNNGTIATLIGALPTGEWIKRAPVVRRVNRVKWLIVYEYWWSETWSAALYGGTGSP